MKNKEEILSRDRNQSKEKIQIEEISLIQWKTNKETIHNSNNNINNQRIKGDGDNSKRKNQGQGRMRNNNLNGGQGNG